MELAKRVATATLLLFVAASVGVLVFQEVGQPRAPGLDEPEANATQPTTEVSAADSRAEPEPGASNEAHVMAYYFHNTRRCTTCLKIETAAEVALRQTYAEELESGRLVWEAICMEEPENEHFVYEFYLASPSLVVARVSGDSLTEWELLDQTWALIRTPEQFDAYVIETVAEFLEVHP